MAECLLPRIFNSCAYGNGRGKPSKYRITAAKAEKKASDGALINAGYMVLEQQIFDYLVGDACVFEQKPLQKLAEEGQLMSYIHTVSYTHLCATR